MGAHRNKHGLSREIPEGIKREIRQQAGFGCVCCGIGIGLYEHIEPEFVDAKEHDPRTMTYLCGSCEGKVTRGILSKDSIWRAREEPWCRVRGKPHEAFDVGGSTVAVWVGSNRICDVPVVLRVVDQTLLRIDGPEKSGAPYRISGRFYDADGRLVFSIDHNEWLGEPSAWDIECVGPRIVVRQGHRAIVLQLCAVPPEGIVIERADFAYKGTRVRVDADLLSVVSPTGAQAKVGGRSIAGIGPRAAFLAVNGKGQYEIGPDITIAPEAAMPRLPPTRVKHVNPNDPCPCGSGRKAKKCHRAA